MDASLEKPAPAPARERLLEAGRTLMLQRGFVAAGVEDLCAAAGASKGAFFHHFESKEALALAVMERFAAERFAEMTAVLERAGEDPFARVDAILAHLAARGPLALEAGGCLIGMFAQELAHTNPAVRAACDAAFAAWQDALAAELGALARARPPAGAFDARGLAEQLIVVFEGALLLGKARGDGAVVADSLARFKRELDARFGR